MANVIIISKASKRFYGQEYKVRFMRNGKKVYEVICFASDLKDIRLRYTRDFEKAEVIKDWLKKKPKKKAATKKKPVAKKKNGFFDNLFG